jgi:hypothetical protein
VRPAHRPQLDRIEGERVECGTLGAKHVGDPLEVLRETLVLARRVVV